MVMLTIMVTALVTAMAMLVAQATVTEEDNGCRRHLDGMEAQHHAI